MFDPKEISSLVYLLDDTDEDVISQVEQRLISFGSEVIPTLEDLTHREDDAVRERRLKHIIGVLKKNGLIEELQLWVMSEEQDLLDGMLILNRLEYPNVKKNDVERVLDKIKLDAWLELNYDVTSYEQIKILNYIIFDVHQFKGNTSEYHHIDNSVLSRVLALKKGNPVSLSIIYSLIAQRLNIPVYGVNLPQHFVLGYKSADGIELLKRFNDPSSIRKEHKGDILFYINPFSEGLVLSYESLKSFLEQLKIDPRPEYFSICGNAEILKRVLRNMMFSYEKSDEEDKKSFASEMLEILGSHNDKNQID